MIKFMKLTPVMECFGSCKELVINTDHIVSMKRVEQHTKADNTIVPERTIVTFNVSQQNVKHTFDDIETYPHRLEVVYVHETPTEILHRINAMQG